MKYIHVVAQRRPCEPAHGVCRSARGPGKPAVPSLAEIRRYVVSISSKWPDAGAAVFGHVEHGSYGVCRVGWHGCLAVSGVAATPGASRDALRRRCAGSVGSRSSRRGWFIGRRARPPSRRSGVGARPGGIDDIELPGRALESGRYAIDEERFLVLRGPRRDKNGSGETKTNDSSPSGSPCASPRNRLDTGSSHRSHPRARGQQSHWDRCVSGASWGASVLSMPIPEASFHRKRVVRRAASTPED